MVPDSAWTEQYFFHTDVYFGAGLGDRGRGGKVGGRGFQPDA